MIIINKIILVVFFMFIVAMNINCTNDNLSKDVSNAISTGINSQIDDKETIKSNDTNIISSRQIIIDEIISHFNVIMINLEEAIKNSKEAFKTTSGDTKIANESAMNYNKQSKKNIEEFKINLQSSNINLTNVTDQQINDLKAKVLNCKNNSFEVKNKTEIAKINKTKSDSLVSDALSSMIKVIDVEEIKNAIAVL